MKIDAPAPARSAAAPNADGTKRGDLVPVSTDDAKDVQDAADQLRDFGRLNDYLNRLADTISQNGRDLKTARRRKIVKLRNYICGNHLGYVDDNGKWIDKSNDSGADTLYYDPETAKYVDVLVASIVKSRPTLKIVAVVKENIEKREAARIGQILFDNTIPQIASAKKVQREVKLNLIAAGETYRYTYFNPQKPDSGYYEKLYSPKVVEKQESFSICLDCRNKFGEKITEPDKQNNAPDESENSIDIAYGDAPAPNQSMMDCPTCGSNNVRIFNRQKAALNIREGEKYVNVGDVECDIVDPLEMNVIGDVDNISSALAVQRSRMVHRCVLEEVYEGQLPSTGEAGAGEPNRKNDLSGFGEPLNNTDTETGQRNEFERLYFQETWLAPNAYRAFVFDKHTVLKGGKYIKKGTKLIKMFPNGLCMARIGKKIVNLYAQAIKECWTHAVNAVSEDFHGIGEWDLSALQDQLNDVISMEMNSLMHDSTSPLIYRSQYVKGAQLKNKIGLMIPVDENFPQDARLSEVATRLPQSGGIPEAYELAQDIRQRMVSRTGAMTQAGGGIGEAEAATKTATGYRLWYEHTLGRRAPMLALRAEMIAEQGMQILEQKQKYLCEKMFVFAEEEASGEAVKWFMDSNIRRDFRVEIAPDSWMPQSEIQQKADFNEFMALVAPFVAVKPELADRLIERISENYSDFDLTEFAADTTEGQIRLEKIIEIAEYAEEEASASGMQVIATQPAADGITSTTVPNPLLIDLVLKQAAVDLKVVHANPNDAFADYPLDVMFDDHKELMRSYTDYLKTAIGRRASLFVRAVINRIAFLHRKAAFEFQKQMSELALAAQQPEQQAQQAQQMQQQDAAHQQQMQQNDDAHAQSLDHSAQDNLQQMALGGLGEAVAANVGGE